MRALLARYLAALGAAEQDPAAFAPRAALRSRADVLRPPYASPFPWLVPTSPEASRMMQVGAAALPPPYQTLLREDVQPQPTLAIDRDNPEMRPLLEPSSAQRADVAGWYRSSDMTSELARRYGVNARVPGLAVLAAESPRTAGHELVHELVDYIPWLVPGLRPWLRPDTTFSEEVLAEQVSNPTGGSAYLRLIPPGRAPQVLEAVRRADRAITQYGLTPRWLRRAVPSSWFPTSE